MSSQIGQSFGRYHILEQLGEGGMATVYKARDMHLEREVAIKVIRSGLFGKDILERILRRFEREAKALSRLTHPNIVSIIDFGDLKGVPYIVMPYLPGGTLKRLLGRPIPYPYVIRILLPIAQALEFAHSHNIVHRDIKPSNILLTENGQPMLSDFGIAKILDGEDTTSLTMTGVGVGTPEYMAPEQWTNQAERQADIYSFGVVFYELVTGHKPYVADTPAGILLKQATEPLPRPSLFVPDLPDAVERVFLKALAKKPEDRFRTMSELVSAMEQLLILSNGEKTSNQNTFVSATNAAKERQSTIFQSSSIQGHSTRSLSSRETITDNKAKTHSSSYHPAGQPPVKKQSYVPWLIGILTLMVIAFTVLITSLIIGNGSSNNNHSQNNPSAGNNNSNQLPVDYHLPSRTPTDLSPSPTNAQAAISLPSNPTRTKPPQPKPPTLYADVNYQCLEGPGSTYDHAVDVIKGSTYPLIGYSLNNPGWYLVAINQTNTHHTCCWVGGGKISGDLGQVSSTETLCP